MSEPWLKFDGYPDLLHDLIFFTPSRVLMVLNLYAMILITTLHGSKILYVSALITLGAYLFGMPYALDMGGIEYVAKFDFIYNVLIFTIYNYYLLANLNLEQYRFNTLVTILLFCSTLGYFLFL
jgi:hypothetical protein